MGANPHPHGHGLSLGERRIMELHDTGAFTPREIAAQLHYALEYVRQVINLYSFQTCWTAGTVAEQAIRAADRRYAAALAATGKRYA